MSQRTTDPLDPIGLIREAYAIDGITASECRSIFLDWALRQADDPRDAIRALLDRHGDAAHPMTGVLTEGLGLQRATGRRGGRRGRLG